MSLMKFVAERNEILVSLDRDKIEKFYQKYGVEMPENDEIFWRGVHKAIANIKTLPKDVSGRSIEWLLEHDSSPVIGG